MQEGIKEICNDCEVVKLSQQAIELDPKMNIYVEYIEVNELDVMLEVEYGNQGWVESNVEGDFGVESAVEGGVERVDVGVEGTVEGGVDSSIGSNGVVVLDQVRVLF